MTYGCANGLERIAPIARDLGYKGFVQGVWDPENEIELVNARQLATRGVIDAICCGNEGLDVRYDWSILAAAMRRLRTETELPVTTTEQVEDYGDPRLINETDFLFPNVHPLWHRQLEVEDAVGWLRAQLQAIAKAASGKPVLIKETGWPSAGGEPFTADAQRVFWREASRTARALHIPFVSFEAFDVPWKTERFDGGNIGPHWGLFTSKRQPKPVVDTLTPDSK